MKKIILLLGLILSWQSRAALELGCKITQPNANYGHKIKSVHMLFDGARAPLPVLVVEHSIYAGAEERNELRIIKDAGYFETGYESFTESRNIYIQAGWDMNEHWLKLTSKDTGISFQGRLTLDEDFEFEVECRYLDHSDFQ